MAESDSPQSAIRNPHSGIVYLIGAGPGAPDLITVRGRDLITTADVVIYADSLVHPGVAAYARPDAAVYPSAARTLEEVMAIMVAAARAGKIVASARPLPRRRAWVSS
jgi:precorrin-4/cobalt-precorrin-4 C11-methyltransferase